MNFDDNRFAGCEPNTSGGTEDLGGDFDLAGAAGRAVRTGRSVFGRSGQETAASQFPPPWPGLGMNPLGPTFRAETQTEPTVPPLPEEQGGEATAEPEDPSAELSRRVLAGAREPDASTRSRGFPPAKAWQDWFTIRLRTWANVMST